MKKQSAGLLVYRLRDGKPEVLIAHMGGPWFAKKDKGSWSIPKGEYENGQDPKQVARREFKEELGQVAPDGKLIELGTVEQKNNKTVVAWATEANLDTSEVKSNVFKTEWPPKSGKMQEFPEIDRAEYFSLSEAAKKLIPEQVPLLKRLAQHLKVPFSSSGETPSQGSLF